MLQRSSVNPISAAADVADVWQGSQPTGWLDTARRVLALPATLSSFRIFLLTLSLIAAATALQVYLSAQIQASRYEIAALRAELDSVERGNAEAAWQIAMLTRLENVEARARSLGFQPVLDETYVTRSSVTRASTTSTMSAATTGAMAAPEDDILVDPKAPPQLFYADLPAEAAGAVAGAQAAPTEAGTISTVGANLEARFSRTLDQGSEQWDTALENARKWMGWE